MKRICPKSTFPILMFLLAWGFLGSSCVDEYKLPAETSEGFEAEIVIQGRILSNAKSTVYVSYTSAFNQGIPSPIVRDAQVSIVGQDGYRSEPAVYEPESDSYGIETGNLPTGTQYAVEVKLDGETYRSEYLSLTDTPEIDEITYQEHEDGISIHVTTLAGETDSRHYMWSYEEDWEIHSELDFVHATGYTPIYDKEIYPLEDPNVNPYYYCWMNSTSKNVNLYSTGMLEENKVKEVKLLDIPIDDIRITYIYSILVKQWSLSDAAYNYYETLKKFTEESGGLFSPMPTEIIGNVSCISNPDKKARGYVLASNVKTKRHYIYRSDFKQIHPEYENCNWILPGNYSNWETGWEFNIERGYVALSETGKIDKSSILYSSFCVDCRQTKGATKKRPDFWPNNHE